MSRLSLLVDLSAMLSHEVDLDALLGTACDRLATALDADRASIWLVDAETSELVTRIAQLPEVGKLRLPLDRGIAGYVARSGKALRVDDASADPRFDPTADRSTGYVTRSILAAPIRPADGGEILGVVQILNRNRPGPFDDDDERYLIALASQLARALSMTTLRQEQASEPGVVLRGPFNRIVGRSPAMRTVYERIARASETDATVLLSGETGTGKGLLARAIHYNSSRQGKPLVVVDCTTLPSQLVESELFGHERGAFTGADRQVPGKVELAATGTLFLDEIGDLPLSLQGKLLRFLQERSFERVGGRELRHADVRIVCATHRDLAQQVRAGEFREDLYYRIKVVTVDVPPLRARGDDEIITLARHFAHHYAERYGRPSPRFGEGVLSTLASHAWPGNVRELEHWVESAVVLSREGVLASADLPTSIRSSLPPSARDAFVASWDLPLEEVSQRYVTGVVERSGGNKTEAARRLGVGRNTVARALESKSAKNRRR